MSSIVDALGLRERQDQSALDALREHLKHAELLLLLDNFEQVLPVASEVAALLAACTRLTVIVTSRAALRLRWEREFAVPPLGLPDLSRTPALSELAGAPAVALFAQRARAVRPQLVLDEINATYVAQICTRRGRFATRH